MARGSRATRVATASRASIVGATILGATFLTGCTMGPEFQAPTSSWSLTSWITPHAKPAAYVPKPSVPVGEPVDPEWWDVFGDPQLVALERKVGTGNFDVRIATVRLAESRASLGVARSAAFPTLNGNANYTRELESKEGVLSLLGGSSSPATSSNGLGGTSGGIPNTGIYAPFDLYQYGFDASWELDLWGRVKRDVEQAKAQVTAGEESRRDALVTAQAEVARDYIDLRGAQEQLRIARENLKSAQDSLGLTRERAAGGLSTDLDVANAAAQVESTRSEIPNLEARVASDENAIALLLGEPPQALDAELDVPNPIPPVPPTVPVGLPSELARRRPDIREAEANLHAATANIGVATADFYPKFTLSGSIAIQATEFNKLADWGQADTYGFGPSITLPIFQGGKLTRTLELRQQQQQEAAITYQRTVLAALHDVDNALTAYAAEQGRRESLRRAVAENRRALALARDQYSAGIETFLSVLDAQRTLLATEQQLAISTATISTDLVALYKALGGGWETSYPEEPEPQAPPILRTAIEQ
jgi:NodT family efflux transporter outer membrane factor (OMF) lipoprotein